MVKIKGREVKRNIDDLRPYCAPIDNDHDEDDLWMYGNSRDVPTHERCDDGATRTRKTYPRRARPPISRYGMAHHLHQG